MPRQQYSDSLGVPVSVTFIQSSVVLFRFTTMQTAHNSKTTAASAPAVPTSTSYNSTHESYTIGWICPLVIELAAARQMLDEEHPTLRHVAGDNNTYVLGRVCGHNVVLAGLPAGQMGTTPAAVVATRMLSTFPNIRFGLLVGIGGGIPSERHDIRLGDIVVSEPKGTFGKTLMAL